MPCTGIANLSNLTRLSLRSNRLQELPSGITALSKLAILDLGQNGLRELPDLFGRLVSLKHLYLSANRLAALPNDIGAESPCAAVTLLSAPPQVTCGTSRRSTAR